METILAIGLFAVAAVGVATAMKTAGDLAWEVADAESEAAAVRSVLEEVLTRQRLGGRDAFESRLELEDGTIASWRAEPVDVYTEDGIAVGGLLKLLIEVEIPGKPLQNHEVLVHE
jgi:hypothetical protein